MAPKCFEIRKGWRLRRHPPRLRRCLRQKCLRKIGSTGVCGQCVHTKEKEKQREKERTTETLKTHQGQDLITTTFAQPPRPRRKRLASEAGACCFQAHWVLLICNTHIDAAARRRPNGGQCLHSDVSKKTKSGLAPSANVLD